jgi:hypothetical protein
VFSPDTNTLKIKGFPGARSIEREGRRKRPPEAGEKRPEIKRKRGEALDGFAALTKTAGDSAYRSASLSASRKASP